jgi:hypothetical protein
MPVDVKSKLGGLLIQMNFGRWLLLLALVFHIQARAASEDSSNKVKMQDVKVNGNAPVGEDVDTIITNKKMRAETGSKSKYSISMGVNYSGGSLDKPFDDHRPNIANGTGATDVASLGGSISGKYALSTTTALLAGAGMRWITPLEGSKPSNFNGDKFDADNPYFIYQYLYRWLNLQSAVQAQVTYFTASNLVNEGYVGTFGLSQTSIYEFGHSGLSIGAQAYTGLGYFNNDTPKAKADQSDYSFGFLPFIEYRLTDRLNLRTSSNTFIYEHVRSSDDANTYRRQKVTENVGVGISITRDVFLYPNVEFLIGDMRSDRSTFSLGANVNLF